MTDLEKFYQLADNIINYPYSKAVFTDCGKTEKVKVYPYKYIEHGITLYLRKPLIIKWDFYWGTQKIVEENTDSILNDIKSSHVDQRVKDALLKGIE